MASWKDNLGENRTWDYLIKLNLGLKKTKDNMVKQVETLINSFTKIDEEFFEELEETLIMSDVGVATSVKDLRPAP